MRRTGLLWLVLVLTSLSTGCRNKPVAGSRQSPAVRAVLLHAAAIGDLERIRSLASRGVDVNVRGDCYRLCPCRGIRGRCAAAQDWQQKRSGR